MVVDVEGDEDSLGAGFEPVESRFLVDHQERRFRGREGSGDEDEDRQGGDQKVS